MILLVVLALVIFPSYVALNYSYFPINVRTCDIMPDASDPGKAASVFMAADEPVPTDPSPVSPCELRETEIEVRVGFQIYVLSIMTFIGWLVLCIFMPTGM